MVGTIKTGKLRGLPRLDYIRGEIESLVAKVKPDIAVIEGYAMRVGVGGRVFDIGELGGTVKLYLWGQRVDIIVVPPRSLKLFVTGKGNADKDEMMRELARHRGRLFNNSDEADAYGLLLCGEAFCDRRLLPRDRGHYRQAAIKGFEVIEGKR